MSEHASAEVWIHGARARSWDQVIEYLSGDAHDRSKVQIYVNGRFFSITEPSSLASSVGRSADSESESGRVLPADSELPTTRDLIGLVPDLTDGLSPEEHVRRLRNGAA